MDNVTPRIFYTLCASFLIVGILLGFTFGYFTGIHPNSDGIAYDKGGRYIPGNNDVFIVEQKVACIQGCHLAVRIFDDSISQLYYGYNNTYTQCVDDCIKLYDAGILSDGET